MDDLSNDELSAWATDVVGGDPGMSPEGGDPSADVGSALSGAEVMRNAADQVAQIVEDLKNIRAAGKYPEKCAKFAEKMGPLSDQLLEMADDYMDEHGELSAAERAAMDGDAEDDDDADLGLDDEGAED